MLDMKQAVALAYNTFNELMNSPAAVALEEVDFVKADDGTKYWLITFSTPKPNVSVNSIAASLGGASAVRDYKVVKIDAESGEFKSLKIRAISSF